MERNPTLIFKIASEEREFEQIHQLNYKIFVEKIPQHIPNPSRRLVDRFHKENTYLICLHDNKLVGMAAVRDKRPFSLDEKLAHLDSYLPRVNSICEVRLLAIDGNYYRGRILHGLLAQVVQYYDSHDYDLALISGEINQVKLYEKLGFVPFGPVVGSDDARFQPMYFMTSKSLTKLKSRLKVVEGPAVSPITDQACINLLPGPVAITKEVAREFYRAPFSHRSDEFIEVFQKTKELLYELLGSAHVEILMGSGTLANDAIAAQLSLTTQRGLILSNGEFGDRLIDHAARFGLTYDTLSLDYGAVFRKEQVIDAINQRPDIRWLWAVHSETSTGILNDIGMLGDICAGNNIRFCLDCISSIGVVPIDLSDVYLASGASGKGLRAYPGLSMVFHSDNELVATRHLPRYLDLSIYARGEGVPYTMCSNLMCALKTALEGLQKDKRFKEIAELSAWIRPRLRQLGLRILAPDEHASPAVITLALHSSLNSEYIGRRLERAGFLLSYKSQYLLDRNWLQICLMGRESKERISPLFSLLAEFCQTIG